MIYVGPCWKEMNEKVKRDKKAKRKQVWRYNAFNIRRYMEHAHNLQIDPCIDGLTKSLYAQEIHLRTHIIKVKHT